MAQILLHKKLLLLLGHAWLKTWRINLQYAGGTLPENAILVLWHEHFPIGLQAFAHKNILALFSSSHDGDLASKAALKKGYRIVRGSSSRGGVTGLTHLLRAAKNQPGRIGMALDGPRGPRHQPKPGTLWLARKLGYPVLPIGSAAQHGFRLSSWDKSLIPLPFSRVQVYVGLPILMDPTKHETENNQILVNALNAAERAAQKRI